MQDNRDDLYLNLRDAGVGEDVIGTQQDFKNFVTNEKNTRDLYKNLRDAGVGEDVIGTEDDFYNFVAPDFSGNKSSGTTKVDSAAQQVVNEYDQSVKDNANNNNQSAPEDLSAATAGAKIGGNISLTPVKANNQQTAQPAVDNTAKSVMDASGTPAEQAKATGPKTQFVPEDPNYVQATPTAEALKKYPWMQPDQVYMWNRTTKEPVVTYVDESGQAVTDEDLQIKKAKSEITGQEDTEYMHPEAAALQLPNGNTRGVRLKKGALTQMADEIMRKEYGDNYLNTQFGRDGNVYTGAERRDLGAQQLYDGLNSDVRKARISFAVADDKGRSEILSRIKAKWGKVADENSLVNAVSDENAAKEDIDIVAQQNINDLNAEIQNISRQMDQRGAEIDNASSPFVDQTFNARDVDAKYRLLQSKLNYAQNALKSWENVKNSGSLDALAGFKDAVMDISAWDFGFSDLKNAVSLLTAKGKDKQELVNLYGRSAEAAKFEDKYNPDSYRYGKIAGASIPFALQFVGTGGGFKSIGSAVSKKATSIAEKYALEGLKKQVVKGLGVAVGDIARAYTMSGTVQGLNTISDILTRSAGELTVDKQGNYQLKSDEPLLKSIYKGVTASAIENYTEMLGERLNIGGNLMRMLPKIGLGRVSNAITKIGTQDWYKVCNNWLSRAGVNDFGGEVLEEEIGIILNAALVGDNPLLNGSGGLLDVRTQKDILGGMLYSISAMRAGALAMYGVKKGVGSAFVKTLDMYDKMQLNQSDKGGQSIFGEGWTEIKDEIVNTPNDKVNAVIEKLAKEHPSKDEQSAIIDYAVKLLKTRGHNLGIAMASDGENDEGAQEEIKDMPDLSQPNAEYLNKDDGMIHKASLYPDASDPTGTAKDVFIIKGNLVTNEDGSINKDASDDTIIYIDGNGERHPASPDKFAAAYPPMSNDEVQQANEGVTGEGTQTTDTFNKGDEVNINVNGIIYTATIQGTDGTGNYNVYYEDEDGMMHPAKFTADQLNEMNGKSATNNGQQETSEQPADVQQQVEQQVVEQPAQQEQKPAIPTDEKGNMLYHQVPVETTINDLYDGSLDDNEIRDFVDANISEADKNLEKVNKKAPKIGTNKDEYLKKKQEWQKQVEDATRIRDYWNSVKDYIAQQTHTTPEDVKAAQDELSGEAARREYQDMGGSVQQDAVSVASDFIRGAKITPESFKAETGYGTDEQRKFVGMIAKAENGGKTIDRLAEELVSYDNAEMNGVLFGGDTSSAKDAILSALQGAGTRGELKQTNEAEEQAYIDARNAARDAQYMEQYGMTYEEYLAYEEQIMPTIWREYNNYDETAFNNMYAEEIEQLIKSRENDTTGEEQADDRGNQVLSEQQVTEQRGSADGTEPGTEVQAGVQGNNENAVAPEEASGERIPNIERGRQGYTGYIARRQQNNLETSEEINVPLSQNEQDEYGNPMVLAENGSTVFGTIESESGLTEAPIKLSLGENKVGTDGKNHGYGLLHIEAGHGEQIRNAGYQSVEQFVENVAQNYTDIKEGALIGKKQTYLLEVSDEHNNTLFIQLSNDGTYWNVNSAGIFKKKYSRRKPLIYTVPAVGKSTVTDTSEVNSGQSMGATAPAGNSSESKDSDKSAFAQTIGEKITQAEAETEQNPTDSTGGAASNSEIEVKGKPSLLDVVHTLYTKGKVVASKLFQRSFFDVAQTPKFMKGLGLRGNKFTIRYGVIARHFNKDNEHDLSEEIWEQLPNAIQTPFAITKYFADESHQEQKGYRLYTTLQLSNGSYVVVSAEVKNSGRDLEVNAINTIFGRNVLSSAHDELIYISERITPEQQSLLDGNNPRQYSAERELSVNKDNEFSDNNSTLVEKISKAEEETDVNPTEAQKEAGNYKKGHVRVDGYDITIEQPKGSIRKGTDANGKKWEQKMNNTYGYIRGTQSVDGDHIDIFLSDNPTEGNVYVVDQVNPDGSFDEHKVMYGFQSAEDARAAYLSNYEEGWQGLGTITEVSKDEFKKWVNSSKRKTKPFAEYKSVKADGSNGSNESDGRNESNASKEDGGGVRLRLGENGAKPLSAEETAIRDAVVGRLRESGLEVITDAEEGQRVLDEANGKRESRKRKSANNTALPKDESSFKGTVILFTDTANIRNNLETLASDYEKINNPSNKNVISELGRALNATHKGSGSQYVTIEAKNGNIVTIRLADHNVSVERMDNAGRDNAISIVISRKSNEGVQGEGKAHVVEYFYPDKSIRKAGGEAIASIARSLQQALYSGEYKDTTGLAEVEEVNGETIREQRVYHGSGADFEAFDHSHMGEGVRTQAMLDGLAKAANMIQSWIKGNKRGRVFTIELPESTQRKIKEAMGRDLDSHNITANGIAHALKNHGVKGNKLNKNSIPLREEDAELIPYIMTAPDYVKKASADVSGRESVRFYKELSNGYVVVVEKEYKNSPDDMETITMWAETSSEATNARQETVPDTHVQNAILSTDAAKIRKDAETAIENDRKIREQRNVRFFRTPNGEAYGFTVGGRIYVDPRVATADTPIHEYAHLWASALRQGNPEEWQNVVGLMKDTPVWDEVRRRYPELTADDDIADEVLATYSGRRGAERLKEETRKAVDGKGVFEAAQAVTAMERVKEALRKFWKGVADFLHIHYTSAEEVADRVMSDLLEGRTLKDSKEHDDTANFAKKHNLNEKDVEDYADYIRRGNLNGASRAFKEIRRKVRLDNQGASLGQFAKIFSPIEKELYERFGNIDELRQQYVQRTLDERNAMEAARKKAEEEAEAERRRLQEFQNMSSEQLDAEYMKAVEANDKNRMRDLVNEAARRNGYGDINSGYQGVGAWTAPSNPGYESEEERRKALESDGTDVNVMDVAEGYSGQPNDYFTNLRAYGNDTPHGKESAEAINTAVAEVREGKKPTIKVYRAVPKTVKEGKLRNGDWVTPSRKYAEMHGDNRLEGDYRIIEQDVPAEHLWWDGNDINEWGFDDGQDYAYRNTRNNRKLNDLITRDDKGNIIPLSQRFNARRSDVRFREAEDDSTHKQRQLEIINDTNPMLDDYHTGIRSEDDIKTMREAIEEARSEAEKYGDETWSAYPDITNEMLDEALRSGKITVYSSKPIVNGNFVTPSRMQASDYAGGGRIYSKTVNIDDVAWINTDEGQYANTDNDANGNIRFRFIGEQGAARLDAAEEATTRLDNLSVARKMEQAYIDKKARIDKLRDSKPVEITGEEYKGKYDLNRDSAQDFILKNLRGEYTIADTGEKVTISKVGAKKVTSHSMGNNAHLKSIVAIPQLLENAIFIEETPNEKSNGKYDSYRYYVVGLKIGNEDYTARITIGVKNGEYYYDHYLTEIEKGNLIEIANGFIPTGGAPVPSYTKSKDTRLISLLQTNDQENARKIKLATGWERGADGQWRYETPDFEYYPNGDARQDDKYKESDWYKELYALEDKLFDGETLTDEEQKRFDELAERENEIRDNEKNTDRVYLDDYVKDDELFKAYPELKQTRVDFVDIPNAEYSAKYNEQENRITVNTAKSMDNKSVLAHEIQHAIQRIEGFANGSNTDNYRNMPTSENVISDIVTATDGRLLEDGGFDNTPQGIFDALNRKTTYGTILRDYNDELDTVAQKYGYDNIFDLVNDIDKFKSSVQMYLSESGEVEARNVQTRLDMSPEERRQSLAEETEDVAREDQTFLQDALGTSESRANEDIDAAVSDIAGKLNIGVRVAHSIDEVNNDSARRAIEQGRRIQGFYDTRTGEIVVYAPNAVDAEDAVRTVLHEGVAHYGLRKLFGSNFDTFLYNVYNNADMDVREKISQLAAQHNWNFATATEEYLASLAEKTNFENLNASWWDKIKSLFLKLLHSIGLKGFTGVSLSDNELRYILWRSYENLKNPGRYRSIIDEAKDITMQNELRVGNYSAGNSEAVGKAAENGVVNIEDVNRRFNEELGRLTEENAQSVILNLGRPGNFLLASGLSDRPIKLYGNKLLKKMRKHGFTTSDVKNLPKEINNPIAVFKGSVENSFAILTELEINGNNVLASISVGKGNDIDFNIISSVYGKNGNSVVSWINDGKILYVNKEKALNYLRISAPIAEAQDNQELSSAANIVKNFENPNISEENMRYGNGALAASESNGINKTNETNGQEAEEANRRFNEELNAFKAKTHKGLLHLGQPGRILNACGINEELTLSPTVLSRKLKQHGLNVDDIKGLAGAIQEPILVYQHGDAHPNMVIVTDLAAKGGKVSVAVELDGEGNVVELNNVSSVHSKGATTELERLSNMRDGYLEQALRWVDKNKVSDWLGIADLNSPIHANNPKLVSIANILQNFENPSVGEENILYREAKKVEKKINSDWRDEYDKKLSKFSFKLTEAAQDAMRSVKILQDIIAKETSAPIRDDENVYWRENRLSSVNKYEQEYYAENYFKPIVTEIANLVKYGARYNDKGKDIINSDNDILKYLIAKHGIERNNYFREREAMNARKPYEDQIKELQKQVEKGEIKEEGANKKIVKLQEQADKAEMKKRVDVLHKDYSGLTELFQDEKDFDTLASSYVSDFEKKFDTEPLWNAINRATKETLRKAFVDGLISRESYENTAKMYKYYIPLRGWANDVASEAYNYKGSGEGSRKILQTAKGRTSLADNPISEIGRMMQDAIFQGNRNRMKQAVYNLAMNHDTSLLNIKRQWYQNMGTKDNPIWERVFPDLNSDMTAEQVAEEVEDFESRMRELKKEGKATQNRKGLILRLHTTKREEAQHRISVAINGKEYNIFVNGNPRAAQAINGELNDVDRYGSAVAKVNRFLSKVYTSINPEFVVTNYQRDAGFAASIVASTEPWSYQKEWAKNMTVYNPITTGVYLNSLIKKAKTGNINPNNKAERYMQEFLSNGGETGFTNMLSADDYKKQIKRDIKSINSVVSLPKAARAAVAFTERANTVFEDATRYATYVTSREQGRTIDRSIRDAKEISLNFNTRGADGLPGDSFIYRFFRGLRRWMIFVNPSIQGLNKAGMAFRNHPLRSSMMIAGLPTLLGYALPAIMRAVVGGGDGDDDDKNVVESYKDLPKWVRRTNIAIPIGGNNFVTIPLSYELRVSYGLGEMMWEYGEGMIDGKEMAAETLLQLSDLLPVSLFNGTLAQSISPTIARPFVDIIQNRNFYGKKIYNDSQFIEGYPEYMKAYAGTPKWLVKSTEVLNNVMPKLFGADVSDKYTPGLIDLNPAMIDYLLSSYLGGLYNLPSKFGKTISMIWDEDMRDIQNVPILSRNWKNSQSGNPYNSGDRYKTYMKEYDLSKQRFNGYKKEAKNDVPEFLNSLKDLLNTPSGKRMLMIDAYKRGGLDKLNQRIRDIDAYDNERYEGEKDALTKRRDGLKEELINKLDSISDGTLDFVNGEWTRK